MNPEVVRPRGNWAPFVASIPHGGDYVPEEITESLLVEPDRNYSDWYTRALYSFLPELGIPCVAARVHRLVADANREPVPPLAAPWPKGVVATTSTRGEPMYRTALGDPHVRARVAMAHAPYHQALELILSESRQRFDTVLLVDLHSFGAPLGVDVVIGDAHGTTAGSSVVEAMEAAFRNRSLTVRRNKPFIGGWITKRFVGDQTIHGVLIEVNQRVYLDPDEIDRRDGSKPTFDQERVEAGARRLRSVLEDLVEQVGRVGIPTRNAFVS